MTYSLTRRTVLLVYALLVLVPLVVVVAGSFKTTQELFASPFGPPSSLDTANYRAVLGEAGLGVAFRNSAIVTACSVPLTLFVGSLAAYGIARIPGWKGGLVYGFLILGMAVPAQANMIPQYVLFDLLGLTNSLVGLVLVNIVVTLPIAVFIMTGFLKTLPREMFEATAIDGSGPWRTYRSIVLPLSVPSLAATAIFLFVMHWNDLLYPLLFIQEPSKQTLPVALLSFQGEFLTDFPLLFTGVVVASAPIVLAYVFLQRYFVAGITAGSVKG
ncbi:MULTISPECIES: carbohydrate ABC transporter permease [unclassified Knoellia]|uniref:carbohydrate ABC transporter permease n=1 Tax=unclassified Knoellia TaxID=2618719 RepID=UPI0023DC906E|nr:MULTISPECIES: carbohydrate ABC transporter permease [unclassified Knoellia]MDF2091249.1 carbohydrate ABC transporter permease [Knoellia sp. 3-2P3]MDF2145030.1 carbohydrate ABC transporter permease [Knoellia sp. p5-6-4]